MARNERVIAINGVGQEQESEAVALNTSTWTDIGEFVIAGSGGNLAFEIENLSATIALADFRACFRPHDKADAIPFVSGTAWLAESARLPVSPPTDPRTLAAASKTGGLLACTGWSIIFQAKSASGTPSAQARATSSISHLQGGSADLAALAAALGTQTTVNHGAGAVTVGVTPTVVHAANAARTRITLTNDSDTTIYVGLGSDGAAMTTGTGIRLNANGGSCVIANTSAVYAISGTAGKNLCYVEE